MWKLQVDREKKNLCLFKTYDENNNSKYLLVDPCNQKGPGILSIRETD